MKKLITTNITSTAAMPIRKATLDHLQSAYTQLSEVLAAALIGKPFFTNMATAIYGVNDPNNGAGGVYNITAGWIMYSGVLYEVDAVNVTTTGAQVPVASFVTTYAATDPTQFTDSNSYNIHETKKIRFTAGASGSGLFNYSSLRFLKVTPDYVGSSTGVAYGTGFDGGSGPVKTFYARNRDHLVTIEGIVYANGTPSIGDVLFTLPASLWPASQRSFPAQVDDGSTLYGAIIVIDTDGEVRCIPIGTGWPNGANFANDNAIFIHCNYYLNV